MSFLNSLKNIAMTTGRRVGRQMIREVVNNATSQNNGRKRSGRTYEHNGGQRSPKPGPRNVEQRRGGQAPPGMPGPHDQAIEYDVERFGLPDFEYNPKKDNQPDPGEIVWTWVPFEENDGRGKDRPVLVLADLDEHVIFAQTTSKDNTSDAAHEARWGRYWMDIGSGAWDSKGRESEVRLDRLCIVHEDQIRREGDKLDRTIYDKVIEAIKAYFDQAFA